VRTVICVVAAVALLVGAPAALAHQGSPNFLSQVKRVMPATDGVTVTVLNRDDALLLQNNGNSTVVVDGYSGEPYARIDPDGTVSVNTDSQAYYLNEERDGKVDVPPGVDSKGAPRWKQLSRAGRYQWHDHRMHWMAKADPKVVKDKSVRTKVFDWEVPLQVDGRPGAIAGTLFWTPTPSSSLPLGAIVTLAALVILLCIAVVIVRRRRRDAPATATPEAW
jgi:hypothetical protein